MNCKCVIVAGETVIRCAAHAPREIGININIPTDYTKSLQNMIDTAKGFRSGGVVGYPVMKNNTAKSSGSFRYVHQDEPDKDGDLLKRFRDLGGGDPLSSGDFDFKYDPDKSK